MLETELGIVLKQIREDRGLSRKEAVKLIGHGITDDILKNIETGRSEAQGRIIPFFCSAYGCSPNYIFTYKYMTDSEYADNFNEVVDLAEFCAETDKDYTKILIWLKNYFEGYFKGCILEEGMISLLPYDIRQGMHYQAISAFKNAVDEGLISDNEMAEIISSHFDDFNKMMKDFKR